MASPTRKPQVRRASPQTSAPEVVDPRWLLKAFAITIAAAVLCAYAAVCLLVYQGRWQYFVKPTTSITKTPAFAFEPIRFDAAATGTPRLSAWWLPASDPAHARTLLVLHDGTGDLSDTIDQLALLHQTNQNLFAIDYRGFGASDPAHPTEEHLNEDTAAALDYLVNTRHLPVANIVPFGVGLGADLATHLALQHPELPALILSNPDPTLPFRYKNSRATLLPMHLLVGDHFEIARQLTQVRQPKLLITTNSGTLALFRDARDPKITVTLPSNAPQRIVLDALNRFLDEYVSTPTP